jgi:methylated-DNA-[protein]-cysteine S-methyltransferase
MRPWLHEIASPLGPLEVAVDRGGALVYLGFGRADLRPLPRTVEQAPGDLALDSGLLEPVVRQLAAYFRGEARGFDLALAPRGTAFQLRVWAELARIPYGVTVSYGALARRLGDANLGRAVGAANGANPISIVVPCHRVIGADGSLTGYGGGLANKRALLELEHDGVSIFHEG